MPSWIGWKIPDCEAKGRALYKGADLSGAKNLTCEQIQSATIDKETKLPNYIKVTWADDDTYTCEMVGDSD